VESFVALILEGLDAPILLPRDSNLPGDLRMCMNGWQAQLVAFDSTDTGVGPPITVIEPRSAGRYRAFSRYLDAGLDQLRAATAICTILADLSQAYCETTDDVVFGLHCGAVTIGGQGVILAGERRAGKSTLVARLSAEEGIGVLCDDVLPVDAAGMAVGLGLAPRLRLPLPDTATPGFRAHVERWLGPADDRYGYLVPPTLAPHGFRTAARAFILLDRRPAATAALHVLPSDELLRSLVDRSITGPDSTEAVFEAAESLAGRLVGFRLVYSDLEDAVALLQAAFAGNDGRAADAAQILPPLPPAATTAPETKPASASIRFRRSPAVATRRVGEAAFLWRPDDAMLWHLNLTAQTIWHLLAKPATGRKLARDLHLVFPDVPQERLMQDICALLGQLYAEGFILAGVGKPAAS
jgi:hypothetical protein